LNQLNKPVKNIPMTTPSPLPASAILMQMITGLTISRSIGVVAQLGIADLVKDTPKTAGELASLTGSHPDSLYRLLRACASAGIFAEDAGQRFALTPLAGFLRSDHPESLRDFARMFTSPMQFQMWAELPYSIQTGQRAFDKVFGMPAFEYLFSHEEAGKIFNDAMTSMSMGASMVVLENYDFSGIRHLVDVGGGHGFLLASVLKKYPAMEGTLFDAEPVAQEAEAILQDHGVRDRCKTIGGDFFKTVPSGADAYLMKHILHDWNDDQCVAILKNCRQGIVPGGKVLVVEMVVPEGNEPSMSKWADLQMLAMLPGKERTAQEYKTLFNQAGFELTKIIPTDSPYSIMEGGSY
jgi:hypothetical protein